MQFFGNSQVQKARELPSRELTYPIFLGTKTFIFNGVGVQGYIYIIYIYSHRVICIYIYTHYTHIYIYPTVDGSFEFMIFRLSRERWDMFSRFLAGT